MGKLADKIDKAFQKRRSRTVHVPEWDMTLTIFPLTLGQLARANEEPDVFRRAARIVILRGKNPDGSPLFDEEDFDKLVSHGVEDFGPQVLLRVRRDIEAGDLIPDDEAQAEKN